MTSYHRPDRPDPDDRWPRWAGESSGAYEHNPLDALADVLGELEDVKRRVLDRYEDVVAWGGTAATTGYTQSEWLALVGRLPGRDAWRYDLLVRRLPALPVTATLLATGQLTLDQAVTIVAGTRRLSGDTLAGVDRDAAHVALSRNRRGDDPDMDGDVDAIVQATKRAADQDRLDRDRLDRNRARIEPDLFGAGRITEDWADPEGFQTRLAGLESAAGQPSPDVPRSQQLAEGSLAMARAWLAGRDTTPGSAAADPGHDTDTDSPAAPAGAATASGATSDATTTNIAPDGEGTSAAVAATTGCTSDSQTTRTAPSGDTRDTRDTRPADQDDIDTDGVHHTDRTGHTDRTDPTDPAGQPHRDDAADPSDLTRPDNVEDMSLRPSGARPTLVVRIDIADLAGIDPADPDTLRRLTTGSGAAMGRLAAAGRLSSTPWLGRQLLDTLACNADLLVAVADGQRPLAEFRHTRRLPDRIRRQVLWRDLGCRWPACRAPVAHCDVHHLDEDPTNHTVDNLLSLCRRHHRRLHSTFWHPDLDGQTGAFTLRRSPTGPPVHTTFPRGTRPQATSPPEVAPTR